MKKFVLSLVTFILGIIGVLYCLISGTVLKRLYTRSGLTDSIEEYSYALSSPAIIGLLLFGLIAILGLVFSILHARNREK
ncbi:MAG: hypothetical protein ACOX43_08585 [Bacilli bacterium]|jgi:hypothetical protein